MIFEQTIVDLLDVVFLLDAAFDVDFKAYVIQPVSSYMYI